MKRLALAIALTGAVFCGSAQEPSLGRLFLTPEQRAALDNARRNKIRAEALAATVEKRPKVPPARSVTINGIVSRSDGESTIWVNGRPTEGQTEDGMRITISPGSQSSVVLREPEKGRRVQLKVGQKADLVSGRIQESYEQRRTPISAAATRSGGSEVTSSTDRSNEAVRSGRNARTQEDEQERSDGTNADDKAAEQ